MDPRVSIILPTFNRAPLLPRAIDSVIAQTYPSWELVVIDDGSTDETAEVVSGYPDHRLRYLPLESNRGVSGARNAGLSVATGELVAFLDSDDHFDPAKLAAQVERFDANPHRLESLGVVLGVTQWLTQPEIVARANADEPWDGDVSELIWRYPQHTWSTMMVTRRHLGEIGGFDDRLRASEFYDLVIRLARVCQFDGVLHATTILDPEADTETRGWTQANAARAAEILVEKHRFRGWPARRARADLFMKIARRRAADGRPWQAVGPMARAFASAPHPNLLRTPARIVRDHLARD